MPAQAHGSKDNAWTAFDYLEQYAVIDIKCANFQICCGYLKYTYNIC